MALQGKARHEIRAVSAYRESLWAVSASNTASRVVIHRRHEGRSLQQDSVASAGSSLTLSSFL